MSVARPAGLPMYDADRAAVGAWWRGLAGACREHGVEGVPDAPDWPADLDRHWGDPRLLLSQTCGYPLVSDLLSSGAVQVIGAFRYSAPGCAGIGYRSELLVRSGDTARTIDDLRGRIAAISSRSSHSGFNALRCLVAPLAGDGRFFARTVVSGSHRGSLELLHSGAADIAAIDCVSLAGIERSRPALLHGLRVIGHTAAAPGLPLISGAATSRQDIASLRRALAAAVADPALADARAALFIDGFESRDASTWDRIAEMRRAAAAFGCTDL